MSKMLEKFAVQSLVEHDGELIFSKEKFAELIVRECVWIFDNDGSSEDIFEHFGSCNEFFKFFRIW